MLQQAPPAGSAMGTFMMMGAIFLIFYFLLIRPQQKQQKELVKMRNSLKKGDKVVTSGGIRGKVESIKELDGQSIVVLSVDDNVKIEFVASAISHVVRPIVEKEKGSEKAIKKSKKVKEQE